MQGVTTAYYLLHSLQEGKDLEREERRIAENFAECATAADIKRIVYLGGLAPDLPVEENVPSHAISSGRGSNPARLRDSNN